MYEVQKNEAMAASKLQIEQGKAGFEIQKLEKEAQIKKELMEIEFGYQLQLAQAKIGKDKEKEQFIEDRKDKRTKIQATQQSELIDQRNSGKPPKNFESSGNDILGGGFDLGVFDPR